MTSSIENHQPVSKKKILVCELNQKHLSIELPQTSIPSISFGKLVPVGSILVGLCQTALFLESGLRSFWSMNIFLIVSNWLVDRFGPVGLFPVVVAVVRLSLVVRSAGPIQLVHTFVRLMSFGVCAWLWNLPSGRKKPNDCEYKKMRWANDHGRRRRMRRVMDRLARLDWSTRLLSLSFFLSFFRYFSYSLLLRVSVQLQWTSFLVPFSLLDRFSSSSICISDHWTPLNILFSFPKTDTDLAVNHTHLMDENGISEHIIRFFLSVLILYHLGWHRTAIYLLVAQESSSTRFAISGKQLQIQLLSTECVCLYTHTHIPMDGHIVLWYEHIHIDQVSYVDAS